MFDANMRYLPKGKVFFVEVYAVSVALKDMGLKSGDVILCTMLADDHENPSIEAAVNGALITISNDTDFMDNWFVYAGNKDGSGFIDAKVRDRAMASLRSQRIQ